MRKDMPYDFEVVPDDHGLIIINTTAWADKNCLVTVLDDNDSKNVVLPAREKAVRVSGLQNGKEYKVNIRRDDLKGRLIYKSVSHTAIPKEICQYVVLVGASVGKSWNLRELINRTERPGGYFWGYRGVYEFDKTPVVEALIAAPVKPDIAILKECAAYFPRDIEDSMEKVKEWIETLKKANIEPVLATVVPITQERAKRNPEQLKSLNEFNQAVRLLGKENGIRILDLQKSLSNTPEGFLADIYADEDGLHLKELAYQNQLDNLLIETFMPDSETKLEEAP